MTDPAENEALPPLKLAVAAGTAMLCATIVYNALAGQDGRQRDVLARLSDLEQHQSLPAAIGVGAFDARPTTKSMVTIEELAALAAAEDRREVLAREVALELSRQGLYRERPDGEDGKDRARLSLAIEAYQRTHGLKATGEPSSALLDHIRFTGKAGRAAPVAKADVDVRAVQEGLARLGYSPGPPDGMFGDRTRQAILQFEADRNLPQTGTITEELAREVGRVLGDG